METFSALLAICAGNSPVPGEFPAQRPVTRSLDVFFDLRLNRRLQLCKQSWGWWFETPLRPLWRHNDVYEIWVLIWIIGHITKMVETDPIMVWPIYEHNTFITKWQFSYWISEIYHKKIEALNWCKHDGIAKKEKNRKSFLDKWKLFITAFTLIYFRILLFLKCPELLDYLLYFEVLYCWEKAPGLFSNIMFELTSQCWSLDT